MNFPNGPDLNTGGVRYMDLFPARSELLRRNYVPRSLHPAKSPLLGSRFIFPDSFKVLELDPKFSDDTWVHIHCNYNHNFVQGDEEGDEELGHDQEDLLLRIMKRYGWIAIEPSIGSATPEFLGRRVYILPPPRPAEHLSCVVCAVLPWPVHDATEKELLEFENGVGFLTVFGLREYCRVKESEETVLGPRKLEQFRERFLAKLKNALLLSKPKPRCIAEKQCESPSKAESSVRSGESSEPRGAENPMATDKNRMLFREDRFQASEKSVPLYSSVAQHTDDSDGDNRLCEVLSKNSSEQSEVGSSHSNGSTSIVHSGESSPVKYSTECSSSCSSTYSEELSHIGKNTKGGLPDMAVRVLLEALGRR